MNPYLKSRRIPGLSTTVESNEFSFPSISVWQEESRSSMEISAIHSQTYFLLGFTRRILLGSGFSS